MRRRPPLGAPGADLARAHAHEARIEAAPAAPRRVGPATGRSCDEAGFAVPGWRRDDPDGLFTVHHGIGSEAWSADGCTPT